MLRRLITSLVVVGCLAIPETARADGQVGLRLGLTDDPDSFFFGVGVELPISRSHSGTLVFEPAVDFGLGDEGPFDYFTIRGTFHLKYLIPVSRRQQAYFYPLGGMSVYYINFDDCGGGDCDHTEAGIDLGAGFRINHFSFEIWAGIKDIPDITFAFSFLL